MTVNLITANKRDKLNSQYQEVVKRLVLANLHINYNLRNELKMDIITIMDRIFSHL